MLYFEISLRKEHVLAEHVSIKRLNTLSRKPEDLVPSRYPVEHYLLGVAPMYSHCTHSFEQELRFCVSIGDI